MFQLVLLSLLAALVSSASTAHFVILGKSPKPALDDTHFILLERRETFWTLPTTNINDPDKVEEAVARATFQTVEIDSSHVKKLQASCHDLVLVVGNRRSINPLLTEVELNRLDYLNPMVRELRWVQYSETLFSFNNNFVNCQCLNIIKAIGSCYLALSSFTLNILNNQLILGSIFELIIGGTNPHFETRSILPPHSPEPAIRRQDFIIASKTVENEKFWYFFNYNGKITLSMVSNVSSTREYHEKHQKSLACDIPRLVT